MGLRIATNAASEAVQKNLREVSGEVTSSLNRLSSGRRIVKASDDAAGLAIAAKLEAQTKGLRQAVRNTSEGISFVQASEGGLNEISNILVRLRELSIQSSSDTVGKSERNFLDKEYQQMVAEVNRISEATTFKGRNLLNGEETDIMDFQVGPNAGKENTVQFDPSTTNASADAIDIHGTNIADKSDALNAVEAIDGAIQMISSQKAALGSIQNRLHSTAANLETQVVNQEESLSLIKDVDVAQEISRLSSNRIIKTAGIATLAQANNLHNSTLKLIS